MNEDYRPEELMVCRIAAEVNDSGVTVLGSFTPLAYAAYMLAALTHAPHAYLIGFNAVGMKPLRLSLTGVEASAYQGTMAGWSFGVITNTVHVGNRGLVEALSPAQVDGRGAYNLSAIGDYQRPKVRLPGGAGSPEVAQHYAGILMYVGNHNTRTLVERVDFRTGYRQPIDDKKRRDLGLLPGPVRIISPLCVLIKDTDDEPFRIESLNPGKTAEEVVANTGFEIAVPADIPATVTPTAEQVRLLREVIDPHRTISFDLSSAADRRAHLREILADEWAAALAAGTPSPSSA